MNLKKYLPFRNIFGPNKLFTFKDSPSRVVSVMLIRTCFIMRLTVWDPTDVIRSFKLRLFDLNILFSSRDLWGPLLILY